MIAYFVIPSGKSDQKPSRFKKVMSYESMNSVLTIDSLLAPCVVRGSAGERETMKSRRVF